ncbi:conserved hypothetical protein [Ricinus communis]|uniref:Uncharacterized protein n=1 Tax=Ricinus communis TaxID=3988 RepID=B9T3V6_RICCO|nr:conserved hypothetical protein [Ricinus communis]
MCVLADAATVSSPQPSRTSYYTWPQPHGWLAALLAFLACGRSTSLLLAICDALRDLADALHLRGSRDMLLH